MGRFAPYFFEMYSEIYFHFRAVLAHKSPDLFPFRHIFFESGVKPRAVVGITYMQKFVQRDVIDTFTRQTDKIKRHSYSLCFRRATPPFRRHFLIVTEDGESPVAAICFGNNSSRVLFSSSLRNSSTIFCGSILPLSAIYRILSDK